MTEISEAVKTILAVHVMKELGEPNPEPPKAFMEDDGLSDMDDWEELACAMFEHNPSLDLSDEEESDDEDWMNTVCSTSDAEPFEDCSSPILQCCVYNEAAQGTPIKVLIDSGSTLDLVSGKVARKLQGLGHKVYEVSRSRLQTAEEVRLAKR